jgi:hypothetical protein
MKHNQEATPLSGLQINQFQGSRNMQKFFEIQQLTLAIQMPGKFVSAYILRPWHMRC